PDVYLHVPPDGCECRHRWSRGCIGPLSGGSCARAGPENQEELLTEPRMRRRQVMRGAGVVAGGVAVTGLGLASPAMADGERNSVTGSWLVTHQNNPPADTTKILGVVSFAAGGVLIN